MVIALGWPQGLPTSGSFDVAPLAWTAVLLSISWALHLRLRWWSVAPAAAGGMLCATMSSHFGLWAPPAMAAVAFPILRLLQGVVPEA
jgi:hypothetical protein